MEEQDKQKTKQEVKILRSEKEHPKLGKISRITFPDDSKIYISKAGWTLVLADKNFKKNMCKAKKFGKIEMQLPYNEINMAIKESIQAGYKE